MSPVAPHGSWPSPVTAASLTADSVTLSDPRIDGDDVYWLEGRPSDGGRVVVVRRTADGETHDVTGAPYNVRARVHEYGGGAFDVDDGVVVFCNFDDTRVYRLDLSDEATAVPITPAGSLRYGDLRLWPDGETLAAVCEDHGTGAAEPANRLVRLAVRGDNADGGAILVSDTDFVSSAALGPDGAQLAWVQWQHPNMPWDGSELCVADLTPDGDPTAMRVVAGGPGESVLQPQWAPDGRLVFASDRTGWWNLYDVVPAEVGQGGASAVRALHPGDVEFGDPQWGLGMSGYGIAGDGRIVCVWVDDGYAQLGILDPTTGRLETVDSDAVQIDSVRIAGDQVVVRVGYADRPSELVRLRMDDSETQETLRTSAPNTVDPAFVSVAEPVTWPASDGSTVHGFYYPPRNPGFEGPADELAPLVVMTHGGPTSMTTAAYSPSLQFWTTRGFAVLDVNYGGSCGYGRPYRQRLDGAWGVVDVDDCATGAIAMAERGLADRGRLAIRGGSAGGYTTLAALAFSDVFTVGCSFFGIGDLEALARETHKFESRYLERLVGPYPAAKDRYLERSPIHHVDRIECPLILLQGADDQVVPRNQAETMADAVRSKGLPVALIVFEGEGHGFRRAENVIRAQEAEAYFYSRVLGFELADEVEAVDIDNLPQQRPWK